MNQKTYYRLAVIIKILTILGLIISAPFILIVGIGLIAFGPLLLFFIFHRRFIRAIKNNIALDNKSYRIYLAGTILSGLGAAYGFLMLWSISHGIDSPTEPFAPFIVMTVAGCPAITLFIFWLASSWQRRPRTPLSPPLD